MSEVDDARRQMEAARRQVREPRVFPVVNHVDSYSESVAGFRCVTLAGFKLWLRTLKLSLSNERRRMTPEGVRRIFCSDCLPQYERAMRRQGRCMKNGR